MHMVISRAVPQSLSSCVNITIILAQIFLWLLQGAKKKRKKRGYPHDPVWLHLVLMGVGLHVRK